MALLILELVWLLLPGFFANMTPVFGKFLIPRWNTEISKKLLGSHKTWRGVVLGVIAAIIVSYVQSLTYHGLYDYSSWFAWGFLLGFGALAGDVVKSFFKRKIGINPGKSWIPFDQLDHVVGALLLGSIIFFPGWLNVLYLLLITFGGHITINWIGYGIKLRKTPW